MKLTNSPPPLVTLQHTIDQWIKTAPNHNPELAAQMRSSISDINATIAQLQQQLTWEREQRQRAEPEVRLLERMAQTIDQSAILEYQRPEAALVDILRWQTGRLFAPFVREGELQVRLADAVLAPRLTAVEAGRSWH